MPYIGMFTSTNADMSRTSLSWNTAETTKTRLKCVGLNAPILIAPSWLRHAMATTVNTVCPATSDAGYRYFHTSKMALFRNTAAMDMNP